MLGRASVTTASGMAREMPVYMDNRDLTADCTNGVIKKDDEIIYRNLICVVVGDFTDEDGVKYTELLEIDGAFASFGR